MTTRNARWIALVVVLVWLAIGGIGGPLVGKLSSVQSNDSSSFLPTDSESVMVRDQVAKLSGNTSLPLLVVIQRPDGLTATDQRAIGKWVGTLGQLEIGDRTLVHFLTPDQQIFPVPSEDGEATLVSIPLDSTRASEPLGDSTPLAEAVTEIRAAADALKDTGLTVQVTGPGGYVADLVQAFAGIDGVLLLVALVVVLVILLIVYRSPILPLAVLLSAVFALGAAATIIYPLAESGVIQLSGQSQGILFILVVGAATDYALLLVSRFKEELHHTTDTWTSLRRAWRGTVEPILASGGTVILGLLCLLLSKLSSNSGLGPVGALGIAGAMLSALSFLPALLMLGGRRLFWPSIPRTDRPDKGSVLSDKVGWRKVADNVGRRPRTIWVVTLFALAVAAAFAPTFRATGITTAETFLTTVESVEGNNTLTEHFPGGAGSPVTIIAPNEDVAAVNAVVAATPGMAMQSTGPGTDTPSADGVSLLYATVTADAESSAAEESVQELRTNLDAVSSDAMVGGTTAEALDTRDAAERDNRVVVPAIVVVVLLVLMLLLRSIVAPVMLMAFNLLSFAATIGISAVMFNHVFNFPGADPSTTLLGFVFLIALGIDYSIFLMTRAREESLKLGSRAGMLRALTVTGGVITSAGIVLASTFSALAVLPLLFLAQIAFIVAFGVLLDTLVVRSLLVPALSVDLRNKVWWPSKLGRQPNPTHPRRAAASGESASLGDSEGPNHAL